MKTFRLDNPNHEDLADLLREMIKDLMDSHLKSNVRLIGRVSRKEVPYIEPYLDYLLDYVNEVNESTIRFSIKKDTNLEEDEIGGNSEWITQIFLEGRKFGKDI